MKEHWRKLAALLPPAAERYIYRRHFISLHKNWLQEGKGGAVSHFFKQELIRKTAEENGLTILIETGTYLGDMVFAMQKSFKKIISIELSDHFYRKAVDRFRKHNNVTILHGDSGALLKEVVSGLSSPALFWLDGHYSGGQTAKGAKECPIYEELTGILTSPYPHVILIDDARLFVGQNDYPTPDELKDFVLQQQPKATLQLNGDVFILKTNDQNV